MISLEPKINIKSFATERKVSKTRGYKPETFLRYYGPQSPRKRKFGRLDVFHRESHYRNNMIDTGFLKNEVQPVFSPNRKLVVP